MGTETSMFDLSASLGRAATAARRGDVNGLEAELSILRKLSAPSVGTIGTRLRAIARAARMHPSYREAPAAQTG